MINLAGPDSPPGPPGPHRRPNGNPGPVLSAATTTLYRTFSEAEPVWRAFEAWGVLTPYQRFDWVETWYRHVGAREGLTPLIVVARADCGLPALIWPLMVQYRRPLRVAIWPGGKFANYKMGLYNPECLADIDRATLTRLLGHLGHAGGVDAIELTNQPEAWQGYANPLAQLPKQVSPSFAYSLTLEPCFDNLYPRLRGTATRKKLRRSERLIARDFGSCGFHRVRSPADIDRVLGAFAAQKSERMREKQIRNVYDDDDVMRFMRDLAVRGIGETEPHIDMFWLSAGDRVAATWIGTSGGGRTCGIMSSFELGDIARHHPGEVLLRYLIEDRCREGFAEFDLGVGEADYKTHWCPNTDTLFDTFLPLSVSGWARTTYASGCARLKRSVKQSDILSTLSGRFR